MKKFGRVIFFMLLAATPGLVDGGEISLTVNVRGAKPNVGKSILSLFNSEESFLKAPIFTETCEIDGDGHAQFRLKGLVQGDYAISVIYDEDSDGELDTGLFGIPAEPVGFSRNARGRFGPPSFEDAVFQVTKDTELAIVLDKAK
jgi:uncharacterized protein (DUF2141 family)